MASVLGQAVELVRQAGNSNQPSGASNEASESPLEVMLGLIGTGTMGNRRAPRVKIIEELAKALTRPRVRRISWRQVRAGYFPQPPERDFA